MSNDAAGAVLRAGDKELALPLIAATEGNNAYEISKLMKETGNVTLDVGFVNTASCRSAITYIDGDAGILRYRGYPIEQLAESSSFLETSYLLIYGELPTPAQLADFDARIRRHTLLHEDLKGVLPGLPPRRAPDAGAVLRRLGAVHLLPGQPRPLQRRAGRDLDRPADGQAADDRRLRLQEERRPAVPLPRQLPRRWSRTSCG